MSKSGNADSHGVAAAGNGRYVWVMDRHNDVADIIAVESGQHVNTVSLNGTLTGNAAPDLADIAPSGNRIFVALRGPVPLSGDPHNATGATPGLGVIQITQGGRSGSLKTIVPIVNEKQQAGQAPDPHGIRVRVRVPR
jgi:DNA-binding beta-propeller fold protein YncE